MADWTTISDSQVDPKAPVTSELMSALRDNPIAITEGASGAPKIAESWRALETTSSNGLIVPDVEFGEGVRIELSGSGDVNSDTIVFKAAISSDSGSTFVSETTVKALTAAPQETGTLVVNGTFLFDRPTGAWAFLDKDGIDIVTGTFPSSSGVTDIRFRFYIGVNGQADKIAAIAFITGGKATT